MGKYINTKIPKVEELYFYFDVLTNTYYKEQNRIDTIGTSGASFRRRFGRGTTTVDGITRNRTDLAYIDTTNGYIVYDTMVPTGDISPYYSQGGNNYYDTNTTKIWRTDDWTWACWTKPTTFSQRGYSPSLIDWKAGRSTNAAFGLGGTGVPYVNYRNTNSPYNSTSVSFPNNEPGQQAIVNQWNFTLARRQSNVVTFFQNGYFSSGQSFTVDYVDGAWIGIGWGSDKDATWGCLNGFFGPTFAYNVALSDSDIIQLYESFKPRFLGT